MRDLTPGRHRSARYDAVIAAIDDANAADPNLVDVRGERVALALVHGRLATEWTERLVDEPDEALLIAARAHHLRRWEMPRNSYPAGRAGYLRWRRDQKTRHAIDVAAILVANGYDATDVERVQRLIRREHVDGSAAVEDAACLVFVETQLASFAAHNDHDLTISVIRKTAKKMTDRGRDLIGAIPLAASDKALLTEALSDTSSPERAAEE
ncbi:MAG TPA: DUF4202 domain-containing protein [Ilumatobacteraceae bacterium]